MQPDFSLALPNDVHAIEDAVDAVVDGSLAAGFDDGDRLRLNLRVSLSEALANAMLNGNRRDPSKRVLVEARFRRDRVVVRVTDEGGGFNPALVPDPTLPEAMEALVKKVRETGAEAGIAYDGDADRIGVADDAGNLIWGDQLLIILGRDAVRRWPRLHRRALQCRMKVAGNRPRIARLGTRLRLTGPSAIVRDHLRKLRDLLSGALPTDAATPP